MHSISTSMIKKIADMNMKRSSLMYKLNTSDIVQFDSNISPIKCFPDSDYAYDCAPVIKMNAASVYSIESVNNSPKLLLNKGALILSQVISNPKNHQEKRYSMYCSSDYSLESFLKHPLAMMYIGSSCVLSIFYSTKFTKISAYSYLIQFDDPLRQEDRIIKFPFSTLLDDLTAFENALVKLSLLEPYKSSTEQDISSFIPVSPRHHKSVESENTSVDSFESTSVPASTNGSNTTLFDETEPSDKHISTSAANTSTKYKLQDKNTPIHNPLPSPDYDKNPKNRLALVDEKGQVIKFVGVDKVELIGNNEIVNGSLRDSAVILELDTGTILPKSFSPPSPATTQPSLPNDSMVVYQKPNITTQKLPAVKIPTLEERKAMLVESCQQKIRDTSQYIHTSVLRAASLVGMGLMGSAGVVTKCIPRSHLPANHLESSVRNSLRDVHFVSQTAATHLQQTMNLTWGLFGGVGTEVGQGVVRGVCHVVNNGIRGGNKEEQETEKFQIDDGKFIESTSKNQVSVVAQQSNEQEPEEPNRLAKLLMIGGGVIDVVGTVVEAVGAVICTLPKAYQTIVYSSKEAALHIVNHRYGEEAAQVAREGLETVGNVMLVYYDAQGVSTQAFLNRAVGDAVGGVLNGPGGEIENTQKPLTIKEICPKQCPEEDFTPKYSWEEDVRKALPASMKTPRARFSFPGAFPSSGPSSFECPKASSTEEFYTPDEFIEQESGSLVEQMKIKLNLENSSSSSISPSSTTKNLKKPPSLVIPPKPAHLRSPQIKKKAPPTLPKPHHLRSNYTHAYPSPNSSDNDETALIYSSIGQARFRKLGQRASVGVARNSAYV